LIGIQNCSLEEFLFSPKLFHFLQCCANLVLIKTLWQPIRYPLLINRRNENIFKGTNIRIFYAVIIIKN